MLQTLKIGTLGGGQFGRKLLSFALNSGLDISLLDKDVNAPWAQQKSFFKNGDPMEFDDVLRFGEKLDILAVFNEEVNIEALKLLQVKGVKVYPSPETLEIIQDKSLQKQLLRESNIPIIACWMVSCCTDAELLSGKANEHSEKNMPLPATKDQIAVQTWENISNEFAACIERRETVIPKCELNVTVSRNERGVIECYEPAVMILDRGKMFVDFDVCPSGINRELSLTACGIAAGVAEAIKLKGLITVEMIVANNGRLYVNDLAIRPFKTTMHKLRPYANNKTGQLLRLLLDLPEQSACTDESRPKLTIPEPAAFRKYIIEQAIKTILCTSDIHLQYDDNMMNISKAQPLTINEQVIEEKLSKAIMIRHLLQVA